MTVVHYMFFFFFVVFFLLVHFASELISIGIYLVLIDDTQFFSPFVDTLFFINKV